MDSVYLKRRWFVLAVCTFSFITILVVFSAYPIIAEDMAENLGFSYTQIGLIASAYLIAAAVVQIPAGMISDKYGGSKIASLSITFLALAAALFSVSNSFEMAFLARALMGVSHGFFFPAAIKLLPQWFSHREIDKAMGIFGTGQGSGLVLTFLIVPIIVALFGWRIGYNFSTITAIVAAILNWFILRDVNPQKRNMGRKTGTLQIRRVINKKLLLLSAFNFAGTSVFTGMTTWIPTFLTDIIQLPLIEVGYVTAVIGVTMMFASFSSGILSMRIDGKNIITTSMLMCVSLPYVLYFSSSAVFAFLVIALIGWAIMFYFGPTWGGIPQAVEEKYIGLAFGVFNTLSFIGGALSPAIVGIVLDYTYRFDLAFLSISLIALIGLIGSLIYKKTK